MNAPVKPTSGLSLTQPNRLASGGAIDRSRALSFRFDGKNLTGHAGDTLASALVANGVKLVGRSFKYHRPRGILSAGSEEPNALVELRTGARREPNTRATTIELFDGLTAASQNRWASLAFDLMAVNGLLSPVLSAGFYYKTFMWPASFWEKVYEPLIRRAAGLGRAAHESDPDTYERAHGFCDVLVIGAGAAGLAAALAAGRAGARVILCDEDFVLGGRLLAERETIDGEPASLWLRKAEDELSSLPNVRIMRRSTVVGVYDGGTYAVLERVNDHVAVPPAHQPRQRFWHIVAKRAVLASGAIERPLVFADNDRPGVMLAGSVRTYLNRFAAKPGQRAVVFANGAEVARTVADLAAAGVSVAALVDPANASHGQIAKSGAKIFTGGVVRRALGGRAVEAAEIVTASGGVEQIACDLVAMSGGWNPAVHLTSHLGGKPVWDESLGAFVPGQLPPGMSVAGTAAGRFSVTECLATGAACGAEAAVACGFGILSAGTGSRSPGPSDPPLPPGERFSWPFTASSSPSSAPALTSPQGGEVGQRPGEGDQVSPNVARTAPLWRVRDVKGKAFVDFQNDVTVSDVELAAREGFRSVEHLKRYTTLGMATDQGKTSNLNGLALMAEITARSIPQTGTTTFRPPYAPVAIGAIAGHHRGKAFRPTRLTPSHDWAREQGAVFVEAGAWLRAQYFPKNGEKDWLETVNREVKTVRERVGVCDVSTLGKIDIQGKDAGSFLDRVYCNMFSTLAVGKARYGLMLREDGFVMDDGTTSRLAENHYLMTTTTANAAKVMQHLEFCHQCLWPELEVAMVSVSEQWAQFSLAGPRSRDVLAKLVDAGQDISDAGFPYMAAGPVTVCDGVKGRLFRLSFSGELAYEIAVPARFGDGLIRAIMQAGAEHGIAPYGTEALGVMRIEKGHVAGNELNGQTTARDLGLSRMQSAKKDFVGRFMTGRPALTDAARPILVGLKPVDGTSRLRAGAHFLSVGAEAKIANDEGYMTSVAFSPTLGHWIGLGFLSHGTERHGEVVRAYDPVRNGDILVEVSSPIFVDPAGERLRG